MIMITKIFSPNYICLKVEEGISKHILIKQELRGD